MSNDAENEIKKFIDVLSDIEKTENESNASRRAQEKLSAPYRISTKIYYFGVIAPATTSLLLLFIYAIFDGPRWISFISPLLLLISYLAILTTPLTHIWLNRSKIKSYFTAPFEKLLHRNVLPTMAIDHKHLQRLLELPQDILRLGVTELKSERSYFEKRFSLIAGATDKIGIIPGILAAISVFIKLDGFSILAYAIAYAYIPFFLIGLHVHTQLSRYDRMIALSELAVLQLDESSKNAAPDAAK